ncbi:monocyte chemotactic protein 1B-like [Archocentrus centrarchus]|uniref:monocyte chemotactic protein 1B-like n=1 Tax=Archocentrus centrarchus TaxID=63155 RepID=UPI0011EA3417|nr:monocyte chemotactic protein 1B-like [Archocentrus centrarchus]
MVILIFVSLVLLTHECSAQGGISSCCQKISNTHVHRDLLTSYYVQQPPSCPLTAVVFTTVSGKRICSHPLKLWTQNSMAYLNGKNWHKKPQNTHNNKSA